MCHPTIHMSAMRYPMIRVQCTPRGYHCRINLTPVTLENKSTQIKKGPEMMKPSEIMIVKVTEVIMEVTKNSFYPIRGRKGTATKMGTEAMEATMREMRRGTATKTARNPGAL